MATLHQNIVGDFFCSGSVLFRNGIMRLLFEDRNVHLCNSDLWESLLQIPNSEPRYFTTCFFGKCFDVTRLHQLHQNIPRSFICNLKNSMVNRLAWTAIVCYSSDVGGFFDSRFAHVSCERCSEEKNSIHCRADSWRDF